MIIRDKFFKDKKIIVLSAPSGAGKSTIINAMMPHEELRLEFSISATSREPRGEEKDGVEYYFLSEEEFSKKIGAREFVEWEEVYPGCRYGTLRSELERITKNGNTIIMDLDVKGAIRMKEKYGKHVLSIFIMPPDLGELYMRLRHRGTDSPEVIRKRIAKAEYEMTFAPRFDVIVKNDDLDKAIADVEKVIKIFIEEKSL